MKYVLAIITCLLLPFTLNAQFKLSIDQEKSISTEQGVVLPNEIIKLEAGNTIKVYLPDGTCMIGLVKTSNFVTKERYECYGEFYSHENAGFGFVLTRDGIFAGAVVMRNKDITYQLEFNKAVNGYVLTKKMFESKSA